MKMNNLMQDGYKQQKVWKLLFQEDKARTKIKVKASKLLWNFE